MVFTLKLFRRNEEIKVLDPKPSWKMQYNTVLFLKLVFWMGFILKPSWKMHYIHINVWNLLRVAYSTLFSMGFAFVPRKNFKFSISIPHSTLKRKIPLWTPSPGSMEANDHQRPEPPIPPGPQSPPRARTSVSAISLARSNRAKRRKAS